MNILVVDDSPVARKIVRRCLSVAGFGDAEITEAGDGVEAMAMLRQSIPDLVLTDLNMPRMDGVELMCRVRASPRLHEVPMIVISSLVEDNKHRELLTRGAAHLLPKPVSPARLGQCIRNVMEG